MTLPLQPTESDVYDLYQNLLDVTNQQVFAEQDPEYRQILQTLAQNLTDLLDADDIAHLQANTAQFTALTPAMKTANTQLLAAQTRIAAIAGRLANAGKVMSALTQILTIAAKFH